MVTRVPFLTPEVDRATDVNAQVRVALDAALRTPLVPAVARPRLVIDIFEAERLLLRVVDPLERPAPALGDSGIEHRSELARRNHEAVLKIVDPDREAAFAGQECVDPLQYFLEVGRVIIRRGHAEKQP